MIEKSARLMAAELLVQKEKRADVAGAVSKGISGAAKGIWNVTGAATRAAADELGRYGATGKALGLGVRAAPLVGGVAALDYAAGKPISKSLRGKLDEFRARRAMNQAVFDPQTGMMY